MNFARRHNGASTATRAGRLAVGTSRDGGTAVTAAGADPRLYLTRHRCRSTLRRSSLERRRLLHGHRSLRRVWRQVRRGSRLGNECFTWIPISRNVQELNSCLLRFCQNELKEQELSANTEQVIATFPWPSSRTPNCQCQIKVREGKGGTRNVYIDTLHGNTGNVVPGVYFRPEQMPELMQALQRANELL